MRNNDNESFLGLDTERQNRKTHPNQSSPRILSRLLRRILDQAGVSIMSQIPNLTSTYSDLNLSQSHHKTSNIAGRYLIPARTHTLQKLSKRVKGCQRIVIQQQPRKFESRIEICLPLRGGRANGKTSTVSNPCRFYMLHFCPDSCFYSVVRSVRWYHHNLNYSGSSSSASLERKNYIAGTIFS